MRSKMVNFRKSEEELSAIDQAANRVGMNRSDFMRYAIDKEVAAVLGLPRVVVGDLPAKQGDGDVKPTVSREDCTHPKEKLRSTTYGIKVCGLCGAKIR